ncbi:MAG: DUF4956 domain-containing protein [Thermoflexales bacterium]|nr:DUF4956 domain-containing protein [Thermoflexales bacterium]
MIEWQTMIATSSFASMVINLALAAVLSMALAWHYERFGMALSNRARFAYLLPLLAMTTTLVISMIKSSLALSLGLVGALSIVRFRAAIKEPEELIYLFIAIAIGLGAGADQRLPTIAGSLLILGFMLMRSALARKPQRSNLYLTIQAGHDGEPSAMLDQINAVLLEHVPVADLRRLDSHDHTLHSTYYVDCPDALTLARLLDGLKKAAPGCEVSFIQQEIALGA